MGGEGSDAESSGVEMVRAFFELQYAGDYAEAARRHAGPGFSVVTASVDAPDLTAAIPWAGHRHEGVEGYAALNEALFGEFAVEAFDVHNIADAGARVFVEGRFRFRHKATGRVAESDFCCRVSLEDGKIAAIQFYENTHAVAAARAGGAT